MEERNAIRVNGFLMLLLGFIFLALACLGTVTTPAVTVIFVLAAIVVFSGLTVVQPNQAVVVTFFGRYMGSLNRDGFSFVLPFSARKRVSLRVRNFQSERLKVNDLQGNPIEIAAVIVYQVISPAKAVLDVENYEKFVAVQSETGLRHIASNFAYENHEHPEAPSLRANPDEVAAMLRDDLQNRLHVAGVKVTEARLTHLAYSPEIAAAMLQRQQASAILAARQIIVEGAVGMVQMVIEKLTQDGTVELDDERKAAMVNNLMVSIVSERSAQPVVNTGTVY